MMIKLKFAAAVIALGLLTVGNANAAVSKGGMDTVHQVMKNHPVFGKLLRKDGTHKPIPMEGIDRSNVEQRHPEAGVKAASSGCSGSDPFDC